MKVLAAVLRKECSGRWTLLLAALALGCVPFLLPLLPGARGEAPADLREAAIWTIAALGAALLAILLGADVVARELAERRMGFYFSRPIPTRTLWMGKLLAAYLVLVAGTALLILPVALSDWRHIALGGNASWLIAGTLIALLVALLAASAIAILLRARSAWLALDGLVVAFSATLATSVARRLFTEGAVGAMAVGLTLLGALALFALFSAHQAALEAGRTDLHAVRRTLARRLWTLLLPAAASFALFGAWVLSASPSELSEVWAFQPAPSGPWVLVGGPLRARLGFSALFLWRPEDGRSIRVHALYSATAPGAVVFSADGKVAAWLEHEGASFTVSTLDLTASLQEPVHTTASYSTMPRAISLSPSGRNLATNVADRWILEDLTAGRILASATASEFATGVRWQAEDRVRVFSIAGLGEPTASAEVWDLGPGGRAPTPMFHANLRAQPRLEASPDGSRALLHDASGWSLHDVASGTELSRFSSRDAVPGTGILSRQPIFLPDGGLVTTRDEGDRRHLARFDLDGHLLREYDLGRARKAWTGGMPDPHTLLLGLLDPPSGNTGRHFSSRLMSLDLDSGEVKELGRDVGLAWYGESWTAPAKGDAARWLSSSNGGQLLFLDPVAGLVPRLGLPRPDRSTLK